MTYEQWTKRYLQLCDDIRWAWSNGHRRWSGRQSKLREYLMLAYPEHLRKWDV